MLYVSYNYTAPLNLLPARLKVLETHEVGRQKYNL